MKTLKCGIMPGKLTTIQIEEGTTARKAFELADIDADNLELRLDGDKINLGSDVSNGSLLVGMKAIKGNCECEGRVCACYPPLTTPTLTIPTSKTYIAKDMTIQDVKNILEVELPLEIEDDLVDFQGDIVILGNGIDMDYVTVDKAMFLSIYELAEEKDIVEDIPVSDPMTQQMNMPYIPQMVGEFVQPTVQPMVTPIEGQMVSLEMVMDNIDEMLYDIEEEENRYRTWMQIAQARKETLLVLADSLTK